MERKLQQHVSATAKLPSLTAVTENTKVEMQQLQICRVVQCISRKFKNKQITLRKQQKQIKTLFKKVLKINVVFY